MDGTASEPVTPQPVERSIALRAARVFGAGAIVLSVVGLRGHHAAWLTRVPEGRALWIGLAARLLVLAGGLALVRLVVAPKLPRPAPALRAAAYLGVGYLAAMCAQPYGREAAIDWAAGFAGLAVCALAWGPPLCERAPRLVRAVDVVLGNACLSLVALELTLAVLAATSSASLVLLEGDARGRDGWLHRRLGAGADHMGLPTNEWGDADVAPRVLPDEACSVVSIGDSFSTGVVPRTHHFTSVAERHGDCDVYNMGAPSIGVPEYLYLLTNRAPLLDPDATVVALYPFNDVWDVERGPAAQPPWLSRDRRRVYRVGERLFRVWSERWRASGEVGAGPAPLGHGSLTDRFPWLLDPRLERPELSEETYLRVQTRNAELVLSAASERYWPAFFEVLDAMIDAAGDRLLFMIIPSEAQVEDSVWRQVENASTLRLDRDLSQRRIARWLRQRGVPVLDLLPVLRAVETLEDGRLHVFHARDTHLNARGNRVVGEALAAFLAEHVEP